MKLNSINIYLVIFTIIAGILLATPKDALANAQGLSGRVVYKGTTIGVAGVNIRWQDNFGSVRYMGTDSDGYFTFASWQGMGEANRLVQCNQDMDYDQNGTIDGKQAVRGSSSSVPTCAAGDGAYGCTEDRHKISVVHPATWGGIYEDNPTVGTNTDGSAMTVENASTIKDIKVHNGVTTILNVGTFYYTPPATPPPTTAPTTPSSASLGDLHIKRSSDATSGTYGTSKRRSTEGGTNINNPIQIVQLVDNGTDSNYKLVATAFVNRGSQPPTGTYSNLNQLRLATAAANGFAVLYANENVTTDGKDFQEGKYYASFNGGNWIGPRNINESFPLNTDLLEITPVDNSIVLSKALPQAPAFQVIFKAALTGNTARTWGNYSYIMKSDNTETAPIKTPIE